MRLMCSSSSGGGASAEEQEEERRAAAVFIAFSGLKSRLFLCILTDTTAGRHFRLFLWINRPLVNTTTPVNKRYRRTDSHLPRRHGQQRLKPALLHGLRRTEPGCLRPLKEIQFSLKVGSRICWLTAFVYRPSRAEPELLGLFIVALQCVFFFLLNH